ncbi:MAG: ATP-binding cassette domain-containing protein, partial [Bacteroidota bacterium]
MEQGVILSVQDLRVSFGDTEAVHGIQFQLNKGQILGIVGESGSGKSVTALSIMQLLSEPGRISEGSIWFQHDGRKPLDLCQQKGKVLRQIRGNEIAMIFQEPMTSLNPVFTCGYQVAESLRLHKGLNKKAARQEVISLFKQVELPRPEQMYDAYPHELSGGQKQRVMIAMAISCDPEVLIADEPTTALDVTVQGSILKLIQQLQHDRGMSVIFITHDLGVIAEIADEVLVMYRGNIVEKSGILPIFQSPQHPYTKGLLACRPPLDRKLDRLPTISDFMQEGASGEMESIPAVEPVPVSSSEARLQQLLEEPIIPESPTDKPLLEVKNLSTWFYQRGSLFSGKKEPIKAVDGVNFEVFPGETLGLVGESGSGKTTLGRSILRLIEPGSGDV